MGRSLYSQKYQKNVRLQTGMVYHSRNENTYYFIFLLFAKKVQCAMQTGFQKLKDPLKGFKILFREPKKVTQPLGYPANRTLI